VTVWVKWSNAEQQVGDHQGEVGDPELVRVAGADGGLGVADEVVAEQADRAAGERRQALERRERVALQLARHRRVGVVVVASLAADGEHAVLHADPRTRARAEERPAAEALTLLRGLQQERRAIAAQLQVRGDRRLDVVDERVPQRHDRGSRRGELADLVERRADLESDLSAATAIQHLERVG